MAHTFINTDFSYGDGAPAVIRGIKEPFSYPNSSTLIIKVNGVEMTTTLPNGATTAAGIASNILSNLTLVATAGVDNNLELATQQLGETATIEVIGGTGAPYLRLRGSSKGITYPQTAQGWTFDDTENDEANWELFEFSDVESSITETWGLVIDPEQAFPDYFIFGASEAIVESFDGWNPGDPEEELEGTFSDLSFFDPPQFEVTTDPDIEPPIGSPPQISGDVLSFERWFNIIEEIIDPDNGENLSFDVGSESIENWGDIILEVDSTSRFEFDNQSGGPTVYQENFPRVLQGDTLIECKAGSIADTTLHLVVYNYLLGSEVTEEIGQAKFIVKAARLDGTAVTLCSAFVNAINSTSKFIRAIRLSADDLGGSLSGSAKVYIAVYVFDTVNHRVTGDQQITPIDAKFTIIENNLDYTEKVAGFGIAAPETHWQSRSTLRRFV